MQEYQNCYRQLFSMVMQGTYFNLDGTVSEEVKKALARMEQVPPKGSYRGNVKIKDKADAVKTQWGIHVGSQLYQG